MKLRLWRTLAVSQREWLDIRRNPGVRRGLLVMPALFCTLSILLGLQATQVVGARLYSDVVLMMYLTMPTTLPTILASHSVAGEKVARTLEPLLAAPLSSVEIVFGKMLAIFVVAVVPTFLALLIFVCVMYVGASSRIFEILCAPRVLISVLVLAPPIAMMAICIGMTFSIRAPDTQAAQSWAGTITLPVLALLVTPLLGMTLSATGALGVASAIGVLDVGAVVLVTRMFRRDAILTRWS